MSLEKDILPWGDTKKIKMWELAKICGRCGTCRTLHILDIRSSRFGRQCPPGTHYKFEAFYPEGRMYAAYGIQNGKLKWTDELTRVLYTCNTCGACIELCKAVNTIRPTDIIEEMRAKYVNEVGVYPGHRTFSECIMKEHNPYLQAHEKRTAWMTEEIPVKAGLMYFVGCTPSYVETEIAQSTVRILDKLGLDFGISPDEWCCGDPLFRTGQREAGKKTLRATVKAMKKAGAKRVITSCPGCYRVLKLEAPLLGVEVPFEVIHPVQLVNGMKDKLEFKEWKPKEKMTYHDPCYLGRRLHEPVYDEPREILKVIPGIELVEMFRTKDFSWCCGTGGGVRAAFEDFSLWTASERLEEAKYVGATSVVSSCPTCKRNFLHATPFVENINVYDMTEVILQTLK